MTGARPDTAALRTGTDATLPRPARVGTVVVAAMAAGTFLQFALAALAPLVVEDLALPAELYGLLTTVIFLVASLCSPWAGRLVDRYGAHRALTALWSIPLLSLLLLSTAWSVSAVVAAAVLAGLSVALSNPATNSMVQNNTAPSARGLLMGLKQAGGQLGAGVSGLVLPGLVVRFGFVAMWRGLGAAVLAVAAASVLAAPRRPAGGARDGVPGQSSNRPSRWLLWYAALMSGTSVTFLAYLTLYAHERVHLGVVASGVLASAVGVLSMAGRVAWGWVADRIAGLVTLMCLLPLVAAVGLALLTVAEVTGAVVLVVGAAIFGFSGGAWVVVGMIASLRESSSASAGTHSGLVLRMSFLGAAVFPAVFGGCLALGNPYPVSWAVLCALMLGAALLPLRGQTERIAIAEELVV